MIRRRACLDPAPWQTEDTVLVVYAMFMQLNDGRATKDVRRGLAARALPEEIYRWMYPDGTSWDAPLMGEPRQERRPPPPAGLDRLPCTITAAAITASVTTTAATNTFSSTAVPST